MKLAINFRLNVFITKTLWTQRFRVDWLIALYIVFIGVLTILIKKKGKNKQ